MADKYSGGIKAGSTGVSLEMLLRDATTSLEMTGKTTADCTVTYRRQGGTRQTVTLTALAAIDSAWTSGGFKEDADGLYRIDLPDAAVATGADFVFVEFKCAGSYVSHREIPLETKGAAEVFAQVAAGFSAAPAAVWAVGTRTLTSLGSLAADTATAVWAAGTRTLSSFGFNVSLATSVWDETAAGHVAGGSTGALLASAASAGDPWSTAIPGGYVAGQAGYVLSQLGGDHALIVSIDAKTQQLTFSTPNVVDASTSGSLTPAAVAAAVLNTVMAESYAADGAQATLSQAIYLIMQSIIERSVSGTTLTIKKLDGTTTAATLTTNSATNPTATTRTT